MKSGLTFLVAARQSEIDELEQLARTGERVRGLGQLIHELQKERGVSNIFLASGGRRFAGRRDEQVVVSDAAVALVRADFDQLEPQPGYPGSWARLFSRVAYALHGMEALEGLRARVAGQALAPAEAVAAYGRLIASLLAVVFEAADSATDPEVSRQLVAFFNFMQGKEFAGQERATGAALFASGTVGPSQRQDLLALIDAQERCLQTFGHFAGAEAQAAWREGQAGLGMAELERLRRIACTAPEGGSLDAEQSMAWFECCSHRIDAMKTVEDALARQLQRACRTRIARAREALEADRRILQALELREALPSAGGAGTVRANVFFEAVEEPAASLSGARLMAGSPGRQGYGPQLEHALLEMMQEQSHRLQRMNDELSSVRAALHERKLVERAKGLLMAHRQLSEEAAYRMLRQTAMEQNRRLSEVAESVLTMERYLAAHKP